VEGTVKSVSGAPSQAVKGIPGMSGSAGVDRTFPARYTVTMTRTTVTVGPGSDRCPCKSGDDITLTLDHANDDGYLKAGMTIKVLDYTMQGDEGGLESETVKRCTRPRARGLAHGTQKRSDQSWVACMAPGAEARSGSRRGGDGP
jgi:hypothetical protein